LGTLGGAMLLSHAFNYNPQLRADIPDCQNYVKKTIFDKGFNNQCEIELKYRKSSFQGVRSVDYEKPGIGSYKKELVTIKNNVTQQLFNLIMHKDKQHTHICQPVLEGSSYLYALNLEEAGNHMTNVDPGIDFSRRAIEQCQEKKEILYSEFVPTSFDVGRMKVGLDEVEPVKKKIADFITNTPQVIISDIVVVTGASRTPFYKVENGKKIIDPTSEERNFLVASERSMFMNRALNEIKASRSENSRINFVSKAELAGPAFEATDLNERFVTKMTPGYRERVEATYQQNKKLYEEQALKTSADDLMNENNFVNLYQVKFKPFHGFRVLISGYKKENLKCQGPSSKSKSVPSATKQ
jgi:hypothetical protein